MQRRIVVARLVFCHHRHRRHYATGRYRERMVKIGVETAKSQINRLRFIVA
jgi:hypothetical protein